MVASLPRPVRAEIARMRHPAHTGGWLTPAGRSRVVRALAGEEVSWPHRWDRALVYWYRSRAFAALSGTLGLLADDRDVVVVNPFVDPRVLAELMIAGGPGGFPSRTDAMRWLCGSLLPDEVLGRSTKASFGSALWGPAARAFISGWDGTGVDPRYVDPGLLRQELSTPDPGFGMILLVHQGWLMTVGDRPLAGSGRVERGQEQFDRAADVGQAAATRKPPGWQRGELEQPRG
jgi:hypothetical protein